MIGVWTRWTNGPCPAGPQGSAQGCGWSTLGAVNATVPDGAGIHHVLHVDDQLRMRLIQTSGKVVVRPMPEWTLAGKAH